jgi:hypothetical protein
MCQGKKNMGVAEARYEVLPAFPANRGGYRNARIVSIILLDSCAILAAAARI